MASLTRKEWVEMWADVKILESHNESLMRDVYPHVGPFRQRQIRILVAENRHLIEKIKASIQSVIGQMT